VVNPRSVRKSRPLEGTSLSEQSTDEGKTDDVTHLDGEAHSTTCVALRSECLRGERRIRGRGRQVTTGGVWIVNRGTRGRTGRRRNGRRGCRGASDVELLGLSEDGNSGRVILDQVDLETLAGGPTGGRSGHGGGPGGGKDILLQNGVGVRVHNHVYQDDCEVSGVSADGIPTDGLSVLACIPKGTFDRACDGEAEGGGGEQESCRENGGGTHCFSWKGQ